MGGRIACQEQFWQLTVVDLADHDPFRAVAVAVAVTAQDR